MGQKVCKHSSSNYVKLTRAQAINERIKELDFKDTKVRVTNVDSQGSDANIVIQVIGEISNQGQPHKRFVQTFVLAEQTNGYFVLNDIFRYLAEDPEEEEEQQEQAAPANGVTEPAPTAVVPENTELKSDEVATSDETLNKVDDKLQEVAKEEPAVEEVTPAAPAQQVPEEVEQPAAEEAPAAVEEKATEEPQAPAEEITEPQKPAAPAQPAQKASTVAMPSGPPKPAAPRTWASLAASAHKVATPVVNAPVSQQAASQPKAAAAAATSAPAQSVAATPSQPAAPAREQSPVTSQGEAAGWQTATGHKKEQSRAQNAGPAADPDQKRAYIKNVYSQVEEGALRAALTKFGEIEYLDISRGKVSETTCAYGKAAELTCV